mmetsp:Transcript_26159/g.62364  ORF Transcript_26159/g.62364 Transcript_26159/m.62364 type:complete len:252 (-) Transcript_26159:14-769(-)
MATAAGSITRSGIGRHELKAEALSSGEGSGGADAFWSDPNFAVSSVFHVLDPLALLRRIAEVLAPIQRLHTLMWHEVCWRVVLSICTSAGSAHAAVHSKKVRGPVAPAGVALELDAGLDTLRPGPNLAAAEAVLHTPASRILNTGGLAVLQGARSMDNRVVLRSVVARRSTAAGSRESTIHRKPIIVGGNGQQHMLSCWDLLEQAQSAHAGSIRTGRCCSSGRKGDEPNQVMRGRNHRDTNSGENPRVGIF